MILLDACESLCSRCAHMGSPHRHRRRLRLSLGGAGAAARGACSHPLARRRWPATTGSTLSNQIDAVRLLVETARLFRVLAGTRANRGLGGDLRYRGRHLDGAAVARGGKDARRIPQLLLVGNGPFSNLGCEAIVRGTSVERVALIIAPLPAVQKRRRLKSCGVR